MLEFTQHKQQHQNVYNAKLPFITFQSHLKSQIFMKLNINDPTSQCSHHCANFKNNNESNLIMLTKNNQTIQNNSSWTHRIHLANFSHINNMQGCLATRNQENNASSNRYQAINSKKLFNKKKGEFTQYLQNHLSNIDFAGPVLGIQRTNQRNLKTKINILAKKLENLNNIRRLYSETGKQQIQSRSPSPLLQKTKIRRQRQKKLFKVGQTYKIKKNIIEKSKTFQLPKINRQCLEDSLCQLKQNYMNTKNQNLMSGLSNCQKSYNKSSFLDLSSTQTSRSQLSAIKQSQFFVNKFKNNETKRQVIKKMR